MKMEKKPLTLRIYVARHCESCAEAMRMAEEVRQKHAAVNVEVVDLDAEDGQNLDEDRSMRGSVVIVLRRKILFILFQAKIFFFLSGISDGDYRLMGV